MLQNGTEDLSRCLADVDGQLEVVEKELRDLIRMREENEGMGWTSGRVECLEGRAKSLRNMKGSYERRQGMGKKEGSRGRVSQHHDVVAQYVEGKEGSLAEQYGDEVRTTYVRRGDKMRLRISNCKTSVAYDYFERGRPDALHTYTTQSNSYTKYTFFPSESSTTASYTRAYDDATASWTYHLTTTGDEEYTLVLLSGEVSDPLVDTPSLFKGRVGCFKGKVEGVAYYKSYVGRCGKVVREGSQCFGENETEVVAEYKLGEEGHCEGQDPDTEEASNFFERLLMHEAATLPTFLTLERFDHVFTATHTPAPHAASLPTRVETLTTLITTLYATLDHNDILSQQALHARDKEIAILHDKLARATFDPKA